LDNFFQISSFFIPQNKIDALIGCTALKAVIFMVRYGVFILGRQELVVNKWVGGIKYKMNVGWASCFNPTHVLFQPTLSRVG